MNHRLLAPLALLLLGGLTRAGDWPQWRGPHRDGVAPEAHLPDPWPREPPPPLWQADIGEGYSSPVVASGRVYILGRVGEEEVCSGLDAGTGKVVWSHRYPAPYTPADRRADRGPKSTPLIEDGRLYTLGIAGMLHCFDDATGRGLWKHDCAHEYWGVKKDKDGDDAWSTCCGAAASPLVEGTLLLLPIGGEKAGGFTAFDKLTGEVVWKSLADRSSYASPLVTDLAGVRQVVGFTGLRAVGLDPSNGSLLWDYPFPAAFEQTIVTPVVWKDLVVVGGENRPTLALKIRSGEKELSRSLAWRNADLRSYLVSPVVYRDRLIGLSEFRRRLVCVDLATGRTIWTGEGDYPQYASLVLAGDNLLVLRNDGQLEVVKADGEEFSLVGRWKVAAGGTWSHLAVAGTRLYVKDADTLRCFDLAAVPAPKR